MGRPNLFGIGVEKSGTTFLNEVFAASSGVLTPKKKELFYFNRYSNESVDWYLQHYDFDAKPNAEYVADITPSYFRKTETLEKIAAFDPNAKIILCIRHPVHRALSHYHQRLHLSAQKLEPYPHSFFDVFKGLPGKGMVFTRYGEKLLPLLALFPRENILVLTLEDDIQHADKLREKLHAFLGDVGLQSSFKVNQNAGALPVFSYGGGGELCLSHPKENRCWERFDPQLAETNIKASQQWTASLSDKEVLDLYNDYFREDVATFIEGFDLDVPSWGSV